MNLIAAVDSNWAIGYQNKLLHSIAEDMKFFREVTTGKVVLMGRKTLESFPGGQPLKKRMNIVLTRKTDYRIRGALVVHSVEEALAETAKYPTEDIYIIGGDSIYRQFLPYCDVAHITKMNYSFCADTWFPNLDADAGWELAARSDERTSFDLEYEFDLYVRRESRLLRSSYLQMYCE